jgi:hypothetical protein
VTVTSHQGSASAAQKAGREPPGGSPRPRGHGSSLTQNGDPTVNTLQFISRAEQLRLRASRNWGRFLTKRGPYTHPDPTERARLQCEQLEEERADRDWASRHRALLDPVATKFKE